MHHEKVIGKVYIQMNDIKKVLMIVAIIALVAITGSMLYYFAFAKPANERAELELEKEKLRKEEVRERKEKQESEQAEALKEYKLYECMNSSYEEYRRHWNSECENLGFPEDSALPEDIAKYLDEKWEKAQEQCIELYGPE